MNENPNPTPEQKDQDPYEFLSRYPGAPNKNDIEHYKAEAPGGRIRLFSPDNGKRIFLTRAVSGLEMQTIAKMIPANAEDQMAEMHVRVAAKGVVWTNITRDGSLDESDLKGGTAGLPSTLYTLVSMLSDFMPPEAIEQFSIDL